MNKVRMMILAEGKRKERSTETKKNEGKRPRREDRGREGGREGRKEGAMHDCMNKVKMMIQAEGKSTETGKKYRNKGNGKQYRREGVMCGCLLLWPSPPEWSAVLQ